MAKPELKDGWLQLAYELDAALELADFTKPERIVLGIVKAQLFGLPKLRKAMVVVLNLADAGGWRRQFVERGVRLLLRSNVLTAAGERLYRLNKYYRSWTYSDGTTHGDVNGSRFSDRELSFIAAAPKRVASYEQILSNQRVSRSATDELPMKPVGCEVGNSLVADLKPVGCFLETNELPSHIDEAPAELRLRDLESGGGGARGADPATPSGFDPAFPEPRRRPEPRPVIVNRAPAAEPIENTAAEVEALAAFALKTWGIDAGEKARAAAEDFHAADLDAAMRLAKTGGKGWAYASSIVCRWWTETGGRRKHRPAAEAPDGVPARASPPRRQTVAERIEGEAAARRAKLREMTARRKAEGGDDGQL